MSRRCCKAPAITYFIASQTPFDELSRPEPERCRCQPVVVHLMVMTPHDPGPWVKFWWKGVDIVADVTKSLLTALIIAVTAYLPWERKKTRQHALELKQEADKLCQAERLDLEFKASRARETRRNRLSGLRNELETFATEIASAKRVEVARKIRDTYLEWLASNKLRSWKGNSATAIKWGSAGFDKIVPDEPGELPYGIKRGFDQEAISSFGTDMQKTAFPSPDDSDFPWDAIGCS